MKTTIILIIALLGIIYVGSPTISFKPFSISFEKPYLPFAVLFLIGALVCYSLQYEKIGYKKGVEDTIQVWRNVNAEIEEEELNR